MEKKSSPEPSTKSTVINNDGKYLRLSVCTFQGSRQYMEDRVCLSYYRNIDGALDFLFLGIFDGHGGSEASEYAKRKLLQNIYMQPGFNGSDNDFKTAIRNGFIETHRSMWNFVDKWPLTTSGYRSTAGTTASCVFIRNGKLFVAHVGDSGVIAGVEKENDLLAVRLTVDHKPDDKKENQRIIESGGAVQIKSGISRVVWRRPIRKFRDLKSTPQSTELIAFLSVSRSLGDLWSYNRNTAKYIVSPEPDISILDLDDSVKCLVLASDGLLNVLTPKQIISFTLSYERKRTQDDVFQLNPSVHLLRCALRNWGGQRADNISVITAMFDRPSTTVPKGKVIKRGSYLNLPQIFTSYPGSVLRVTPFDFQVLDALPINIYHSLSHDSNSAHDYSFEGPGHISFRSKNLLKRPKPLLERPKPSIFLSRSVPSPLFNSSNKEDVNQSYLSDVTERSEAILDVIEATLVLNQNTFDPEKSTQLMDNEQSTSKIIDHQDEQVKLGLHSAKKRSHAILITEDFAKMASSSSFENDRVEKDEQINLRPFDTIENDVSDVSINDEAFLSRVSEMEADENELNESNNIETFNSTENISYLPAEQTSRTSIVHNNSLSPWLMLYTMRARSREYIQDMRSSVFRDLKSQSIRSSRKRSHPKEDASVEQTSNLNEPKEVEPPKKRLRILDFLSYLWYGDASVDRKN